MADLQGKASARRHLPDNNCLLMIRHTPVICLVNTFEASTDVNTNYVNLAVMTLVFS